MFESDDGKVTVIGDNTIVQYITKCNINGYRPDEGRNFNISSSDESHSQDLIIHRPVVRLSFCPESPVYSCTNANLAFPDRQLDHRFELTVFKNSKEVLDCNFTDPYDLNNWGIDVAVTRIDQDGNYFSGSSLGCSYTSYKKRDMRKMGRGKCGFWFRFQRRNAKYKIIFTLKHYTTEKIRGGNEKRIEEIIHFVEKTVFTDEKRDANRYVVMNPNGSQVGRAVVLGIRADHDQIITSLCRLRDQGKWEKFEQKASFFLAENYDIETKAVVLLEMSMGAVYNNRLDKARQLIQESLNLAESIKGESVFPARAQYYLAGVHRREKNFGEAEKCIDTAEQCLTSIESDLDRGMLLYEKGGNLMDFVVVGARKPSERLISMTRKNLEQSIEILRSLEGKIYTKKHHFALLRIAMLMLDCRSQAGRSRSVKTVDVKSAEQCLNELKSQFKSGAPPRGLRVQYMMARSDECYRNRKYTEAVETAKEALSLAQHCGFNTEISTLKDRVECYQVFADRQREDLDMLSDEEYMSCDEGTTPGGDISSSS